jgi:predicted dienelactone hydrolase
MTRRHTLAVLSFAIATCLCAGTSARAEGLQAPDGRYAVGVVRTEFVDAARTLEVDNTSSGPRRLPAVVWYPAQIAQSAKQSSYLTDGGIATTLPAIARLFAYPTDDPQPLAATRVQAEVDARPAKTKGGFPIVIYSHGLFLYPEQNTALATQLASHGYIVVSIAHPGDSADLSLADGTVVTTQSMGSNDDARFAEAWKVLAAGPDLPARRQALARYTQAQPGTRIGRAATQWRDDAIFVANVLHDQRAPQALQSIMKTADRDRLAFAGMSMGGAAAAAGCRHVAVCKAVVNLDGQNIDADLYDQPVERPLLLMLSDWPRYGLLPPQPKDPSFSPNDLAYEPWQRAGQDASIVRLRVQGLRHLGFTDLGTLMEGPKQAERFGDLAPAEAAATVDDVVQTFLDIQLKGATPTSLDAAIARHPALLRHTPAQVQRWAAQAPAAE